MDWTALWLSCQLAITTVIFLLPISILLSRWLAYRDFFGKGVVEALVALPLVLPPTVFGFYLMVGFGAFTLCRATYAARLRVNSSRYA